MKITGMKLIAIFFVLALAFFNTNNSYSATFCVGTAEDLSNALTIAATNNEDDTIKILEGTYFGSFVYAGGYDENNTIELLGGYSNNCTERVNDYSKTVLDSGSEGTVLTLGGGSSTYFIVDGLTIQNGKYENWGGGGIEIGGFPEGTISNCKFFNNTGEGGGGITFFSASANITNCLFLDNSATRGGGIGAPIDGYIDVNNCQFIGNHAEIYGGGVYLGWNSVATITDCTFTNNTSQYGGGVGHWYGFPYIYSSTFVENLAVYGGAVSGISATGDFINCIFANNTADYGGAMYNFSEAGPGFIPFIMNSTFYKNHANVYGGGILNVNIFDYPWPVPITNSIFWENTAPLGAQIHNAGTAPYITDFSGLSPVPVVIYCNIQGGYAGEGNISADPLLNNPQNVDFHIKIDSPCINAGTLAGAANDDFDGEMRPQGTGIDMGADEYTFNVPDILDFFDRSVLEGTLVGYGPGNSADGRLNSLKKMLERANGWIKQGEIEKACTQLKIAFESCDGVDQKSEFAEGEAVAYLNYIINEIMVSIGCESALPAVPLYTTKLLNTVPTKHTNSPPPM